MVKPIAIQLVKAKPKETGNVELEPGTSAFRVELCKLSRKTDMQKKKNGGNDNVSSPGKKPSIENGYGDTTKFPGRNTSRK